MTKVNQIYLAAVIWGIISSIISVIMVEDHSLGVPTVLTIVMDVVAALIILLAGRRGKRQGARPAGVGIITGLLYGVVSGWPTLLVHLTRAEFIRTLRTHHLPVTNVGPALQFANSVGTHLAQWAGAAIVGLLLGLILGTIGGVITRNPASAMDV